MTPVCKVDGCSKEANRNGKTICEMHYGRLRRSGTLERVRKRSGRLEHPSGYQRLYMRGHPLQDVNGYVYEHRYVVFSIFGRELPPCALCGTEISWTSCHIDHIDDDPRNNKPSNLRPTCSGCNTNRTPRKPEHEYEGHIPLSLRGETKTPAEWARDDRVSVSSSTILRRLRSGWDVEKALLTRSRSWRAMGRRRTDGTDSSYGGLER